jgi:hypothetical protein
MHTALELLGEYLVIYTFDGPLGICSVGVEPKPLATVLVFIQDLLWHLSTGDNALSRNLDRFYGRS